jgi:hypothetical protein
MTSLWALLSHQLPMAEGVAAYVKGIRLPPGVRSQQLRAI